MIKNGFLLLIFLTVASFSLPAYSQNESKVITVKGTVCDEKGRKIRQMVVVRSMSNYDDEEYTCMTESGLYKVKTEADGRLLVATQGHFKKEVDVNDRTEIDIVLEKDNRRTLYSLIKVADEEGNPLKSVLIMASPHPKEIGGPTVFLIEKDDGTIYCRVVEDNTLTFSLDGYETQEVPVDKRDEINVVMKKKQEQE